MTNVYTYLYNYIKTLAESNEFVNSVRKGDIQDIDLDKANIFQMVHININNGAFPSPAVSSFDIELTVLQKRDITDDELTDYFWRQDNEVDNLNETMNTLKWLWNNIYKDWQDIYISTEANPSFDAIVYGKGNLLDGWTMTFSVQIPHNITVCNE